MLKRLGIESWLQLGITVCVVSLIIVSTLDENGAALFFTYRTLLVVIMILCAIGSPRSGPGISRAFLGLLALLMTLVLISVFRIPGSHFEAFSIFYRHAFFIGALLSLAHYNRYQSARWKGTLLAVLVAVNLAHLLPDLIRGHRPVAGFAAYNPDYFGTFLLIGFAASLAVAVFGAMFEWRVAAAISAALLVFGIIQTSSRGAVLAAVCIVIIAAVRSGGRIPRQVWLLVGLGMVLLAVISSPYLTRKFVDRGEDDPYNYARIQIWMASLRVIAEHPVFGAGPGQFFHVSKRFNFPVEGQVARYVRHVGIAHSEYLEHIAELGVPAAFLLFSLFGYLIFLAWRRAGAARPEYRCFQEAAVLTAAGVGAHSLVDNCWTVPVMAAAVVTISLADLLPMEKKAVVLWGKTKLAMAGVLVGVVYLHSVAIPAVAIYYNDLGHRAYQRSDFANAEPYYLSAIAVVTDHSAFLDNLGVLYLDRFNQTKDPGTLDLARKYLDKAIAGNPRALEPHMHMEEALLQSLTGKPEKDLATHKGIIENNTQLLGIDPYFPFPRKNLAAAYYNLGQRERAFEEMRKALEYEPNYVPAYLQIASWYGDRGDKADEQRYTAAAMSIISKYRDVKPGLAYESILLGRPESEWKQ